MKSSKIFSLYQSLYKKYGAPQGQWNLWCKRPKTRREKEEVIIGAILTQRTNWRNIELALANLKKARLLSLNGIYGLRKSKIKEFQRLIRSSGFYRTKSRYLLAMAEFFVKSGGVGKVSRMNAENLRKRILDLPGVGPETADSILLYALEKPFFVIDAYTRRLLIKAEGKFGPECSGPYENLRRLFEKELKKFHKRRAKIFKEKSVVELYQDFHALIVIDGKNRSDKRGF